MFRAHILSIVLFTPLVGVFVLLMVPKENKNAIRWIANLFALAGFLVSLPLVPWFWAVKNEATPYFKFAEGSAQQLDPFDRRGLSARHRRHLVPADHADDAARAQSRSCHRGPRSRTG